MLLTILNHQSNCGAGDAYRDFNRNALSTVVLNSSTYVPSPIIQATFSVTLLDCNATIFAYPAVTRWFVCPSAA